MIFKSDYILTSTDGKSREMYINHTFLYMQPLLFNFYGSKFVEKYNSISKLFLGTKDESFIECKKIPYLCLLFYTDRRLSEVSDFFDWIREQDFYITDYFYGHISSTNKHVVILEVPEHFRLTYQRFIQGMYSKIYTEEKLKILKEHSKSSSGFWIRPIIDIVEKTENSKKQFLRLVNREFNTNISNFESENFECDFPPLKYHQHLNYKENDFTYCRTKG